MPFLTNRLISRIRCASFGTAWLLLASLSMAAPAHDPAEISSLIALLGRPDSSLHQKARACQQLGEFGTKDAVPALAALLSHDTLSAYARSGLEGIADPSAAAALRSAITTSKGNRLIGVVNSLGALRDVNAVPALAKLAANPASGAAREALLALGRIGNAESVKIVRRALSAAPEASRPDAAAACLIAAEVQLADGNSQTAIALYDAVRAAPLPTSYKLGATSGALVARGAGGINLFVELLKSDEREVRNVALLSVRRMPCASLAETLNSALESARPEVQAQLIEAIADCHNPRSIQAVRTRLASENAFVRQAAFRTLGKIGDQSDAPRLLKGMRAATMPSESSAAFASLARLKGDAVDAVILENLAATTDPGQRVTLIELLDARSPLTATGELLKQAADPDARVSLAALGALRSLAGVKELPALIALTKTCKDGTLRAAAEAALYYSATRSADLGQAGQLLLSELRQATGDLDKASWIKTLAAMGYSAALPAISPTLRDSNPWLVGVTVDNLSKWPGPAPIDDLLGFLESGSSDRVRESVLTGAVHLAATAGNARQAPAPVVTAWFQRAGKAARSTGEKRVVLSALGRWTEVESVRLLLPYLDDPAVKTDAASSILTAAAPVALGPDFAMLEPVLERISGMGTRLFADRISLLRRNMAATESQMKAKTTH